MAHVDYTVPEFHLQGSLGMTNVAEVVDLLRSASINEEKVDVGLQVSREGRIWICVNGMALIRFKPDQDQMYPGWAGI